MSADFISSFSVLDEAQKQEGLKLLIVGGFAVNAHGFSRFTADLDCLIVTRDIGALEPLFSRAGFTRYPGSQVAAFFENPKAKPSTVDVLLVNENTFEKMWLGRVSAHFEGLDFFVPAIDHIFAMKFHSVKQNWKRWGKDLRDLHELVRAHPGVCTREKVMEWCQRFGPQDPAKQQEALEFVLAYSNE
jgi:hypothetical protein